MFYLFQLLFLGQEVSDDLEILLAPRREALAHGQDLEGHHVRLARNLGDQRVGGDFLPGLPQSAGLRLCLCMFSSNDMGNLLIVPFSVSAHLIL